MGSGGVKLFLKYGIVPTKVMNETKVSNNSSTLITLMNEKLISDIKTLIALKKENQDIEKIETIKDKMLSEDYEIFAKCFGEPITKFDLEYYDKDHKYIEKKDLTPISFMKKYLTIKLEDIVSIGNIPAFNRKFYQKYITKNKRVIWSEVNFEYLNLPMEEITKAITKQLKDGLPVSFSITTSKYFNRENWIADNKMYEYEKIFPFQELSKEDLVNFYKLQTNHAMTLVGFHKKNEKIVKWKVENSWGDRDCKQYITMSNDFFEKYLKNLLIDKKYLSEKAKIALNQKAIIINDRSPY